MKKSLETRMDEIQFHLVKAAELTEEWWEARKNMSRSMETMDETTDFFVEVAREAVRTEMRYISQIRFHRNKAKRLIRKFDKSPMALQTDVEVKDPQEKTEMYDVASLRPAPYLPNVAPRN